MMARPVDSPPARESRTMPKRVVAIPGEDAAPEAFHPTVKLVDRLGLDIEWVYPKVGQAGIEAFGHAFPSVARDAIDAADATLFGSTSGPSALALFYLRWEIGRAHV